MAYVGQLVGKTNLVRSLIHLARLNHPPGGGIQYLKFVLFRIEYETPSPSRRKAYLAKSGFGLDFAGHLSLQPIDYRDGSIPMGNIGPLAKSREGDRHRLVCSCHV